MRKSPTIKELYDNISDDLKNRLDLSDVELKKVLDALSASLAGQLKLLYLRQDDVYSNLFADTADTGENGGTLDRQGLIFLNRIKRPATDGLFRLRVTGEIGSTLRANLTFKSNDGSLNPGKLYILDSEKILTTEIDYIEVRSVSGGSENSLLANNSLTITEPVIGVDQTVLVDSVIEEPLSEESEEDYRRAIIRARQQEPQGGAKTDYRLWADDAQGVRYVYPYVKDGEAGVMQIYVEATEEDSTDGLGTPSQALMNSVEDVLNFDPDETKPTNERGRRPAQAELEILPISANAVDVSISELNIDTPAIRASIEANLISYMKDVRPFVSGADLPRNKNDIMYAAKVQSVVTDTIDAANFFTGFDVQINGVVQTSYLFSKQNIPYLRNLTFN